MFLYKITNTVNGKFYIGVSVNPERRFREHYNDPCNKHLKFSMDKYGIEKFSLDILAEGEKRDILEAEAEIVNDALLRSGLAYNMALGGGLPCPTPEGQARAAQTRKELMATGQIPKPPRATLSSSAKSAATRKAMGIKPPKATRQSGLKSHASAVYNGNYSPPPRPSAEAQKKAGETRKMLHAEGKIDIGPNRDETVYQWVHKDGRTVNMRRSDMEAEYGLPSGNITNLLKGRAKTCLGWRIVND
ncbi:hypothetical protein MYOV003v1_p0110 [Vibrio phage 207E48.1]|nr:hypothetical protein MYOV003v1_p0110 [Vibrio phage 207E48.1]